MMTQAKSEGLQEYDFSSPSLYNPVYLPLFYNKSRFLHLFGSAGSGKSVFGCQKEIVLSFQGERRGRKTLCIRKVYNTIAHSIYAELKNVIYEWNLADCFEILKSPLQIRNIITDVTFIFIGMDDPEKVKSIRGVDRIIIEEATELKEQSELDQLNLRVRGYADSQITLMYNPVNVNHWINKEIHDKKPANHFIKKTTYRDNVRLLAKDPDYATNIESLKTTNPNYYRIYGLGLWGNNPEGLVYPEYETVPEMPALQFYGLDFGYNDPCALIGGAVVDEPNKAKKSYYIKELLYENKHTSDTLGDKMEALGILKNLPIVADCSRPEIIASLRKRGFRMVESEKGKGSVKAGIDLVKLHDLRIAAGSKELLREVSNYAWQNKNGEWLEEPADGADHLCDAFRYGIQASVKQVWKFGTLLR